MKRMPIRCRRCPIAGAATATFPVMILVALAMPAPDAAAREYAPRVLSPHNADAYSMRTFAQFPRWRDLEGDAKVYEVYEYLADRRTGIFPMGAGAWEGRDSMYEFGYVRDPVKMINVYSVGYCDMLGPTMAGIMQDMGIGPARTVNLPGLSHVVAEVSYGGRWHYLDLDLRAVFRRPDGSLASLAEARRDDSLWKGPPAPLFFPLDNLERTRRAYAASRVQVRHGVNQGGHTMDYVLRQGETFTRWWQPQGNRWNHHESYNTRPFPRNLVEKEPKGPKCKHPSFTVHTHGNGRFVYAPDLTERSSDFRDGVYEAQGVRPGPEGLVGQGHAIFEVRSPYVIVPEVGDFDTTKDNAGASVVRLDAQGVTASLSVDNGLTWAAAPASLDLTPIVAGRYGYLLKLDFAGADAVVRSLQITTWVQLHPASLPSLRKGTNTMRYVTGDHHGLDTQVVEIRTNGSDRADFLKYLVEPPADYDPKRTTQRVRGTFTAQVSAPPGMQIAWFSGGGSFNALQGNSAPRTANAMAWSTGRAGPFVEFYRASIPEDQSHWHYNADVEVRLPVTAKTIFIRYIGDPGVNNLRIYAHCLADVPLPRSPVVITHAWREGDARKTQSVRLERPGPYEIAVEGDPVDESIELAVPSRPVGTEPAAESRILEGHWGSVLGVAFSPDGRTLATCSRDSTIGLWDTKTAKRQRTLNGHTADVYAVVFSPDGNLLASAGGDGTVRLWDPQNGQVLRILRGHGDIVRAVAFSPDQRTLASVGVDMTLRLWDARTGELERTLKGHTARVKSVTYSPDGRTLATASSDRTVRLWNAHDGSEKAVLEGHTGGLEGVAISPDGRTLASSGEDGTVRLWDAAAGKVLHVLKGHNGEVDAVAFSPDGDSVASGCKDTTIKLWNPRTGELRRTLTGHTGRVESLAFSPDGTSLASGGGGGDTSVRLWDMGRPAR